MEKIKLFLESDKGKDILIVLIVILVGLGSFELGRLSKENDSGGLKINYTSPENVNTSQDPTTVSNTDFSNNLASANIALDQSSNISGKNFFASTRGKKYYSLGCSAGKTIKQENRVYFATGEEAQKAGYTLSSSCN